MTYAELQSRIADWLIRQDLTAVIPTFIELCEEDLNRELRVRQMLVRSTATLEGQFLSLPTDWLEARNLQLNTTPVRRLEFVTLDRADDIRASGVTTPAYYTINGAQIEVVPEPTENTEIEMVYYAKIPPIAVNNTNWLSLLWPSLYIYGALRHSAPYLKEDERAGVWEAEYRNALERARMQDQRAQFSGGPLKMRPTKALG